MEATFCILYVTTVEYLCQWFLYIMNLLGPENGSYILYDMCYYSRIPVSMVTIYTEHIRSRKWKPHFVCYMLLQQNTCVNGYYQWDFIFWLICSIINCTYYIIEIEVTFCMLYVTTVKCCVNGYYQWDPQCFAKS